jgi:hypothetical protein
MRSEAEARSASVQHQLAVTADIEHGKRNLDDFGYTIHPGFLTADELAAVRARFIEQLVPGRRIR